MGLSRVERIAALAVVGMTAAVVGAGVKLIRRHNAYVSRKAAAFFEETEEAADGSGQSDIIFESGSEKNTSRMPGNVIDRSSPAW